MTTIIDGRKLSTEILKGVKSGIASLSFQPVFCDILVGNNPASIQYVNMKKRMSEEIGVQFYEASFSEDISIEELVKKIQEINSVPNMCGIIVQLPLPKNLDQERILDAVDSDLDVDCLSTIASTKFYNGDIFLGFPTALACMYLLDFIGLELNDKKIVVIGQGKLVGKPVTALLNFRGLNPRIVRSRTENKENIIKDADIIISGMGQGKYIKKDMIKEGAVIIDAGTSESNSGIIGDVDLDSVNGTAGFISPVPGGVGPVTVAMLFRNVLKVAQKLESK